LTSVWRTSTSPPGDATIRAMISGGALLAALFFLGTWAAAGATPDAAPQTARLDVRAAPECMSRGDVAARVASRSQRIQFVDEAAVSAQVEATSSRPGNVIVEVVFATAGVEQPPRRFVARSCAEAADAAALIIAVTLDPKLARKSATGLGDTAKVTPPGAGSAATEPGASPNPPAAETPPERPPDAQEPGPSIKTESAAPAPAPTETRRYGFAVHLAGQTIFGAAPSVMPGLALEAMTALDRDGPWSPALFVGVMHVWRSDLSQRGGSASFTLDAASVDACPLRLRWSRLAARPCASALFGRLATAGAESDNAATAARPFATAGGAIVVTVDATVELSARLGVGATLIRDSYEFASSVFHRASPVTVSASLGVGYRWP
jgi:hypothetical protein